MTQLNPSEWGHDYFSVITTLEEPMGFKICWRGSIVNLIYQIGLLDAGYLLLILPDAPQPAPPHFAEMIESKFSVIGWWDATRGKYVVIYAKRRIQVFGAKKTQTGTIDLTKVREGPQVISDWQKR